VVFAPGATLVEREVWRGRVWLEHPVRVVSDDGAVLAVVLEDGVPFAFDTADPPHPWSAASAWSGPTVLQLRRPGDWYSVWRFYDDGVPRCWYVNFERPVVRTAAGIDTDDLELDLVVEPDGARAWKDVEQLHARLVEGRFSLDDLQHVLAAAAEVSDRLDRDDRWWAPWDTWVPAPSG
jgi:hypothetical protein